MGAVNPYDEIFSSVMGAQKKQDANPYDDIFAQVMKAAPAQERPQPAQKPDVPGVGESILIAAGRSFDKLGQGIKQTYLGGKVAAKQLTGAGDSSPDLRELARMRSEQAAADSAYAPLKEARPFATGLGEGLPSLMLPMGQASLAARLATPALGMAAMGGASYGDNQTRAFNAVTGAAEGLAGAGLGELGARVLSPAKSYLGNAERQAVTNAADRIGVRLRPSQLTGNQTLSTIEDNLSRSLGSGGVFADFAKRNEDALAKKAASAIGYQLQPGESLTRDVLSSAKSAITAERDALRQMSNMPVTQPVLNSVDAAIADLSLGAKHGKTEALSALADLKESLWNNKQFDGKLLHTWVSDLKELARNAQNGTASAKLRDVARTMESVGQGVNRPLWANNDAQYAAYKTLSAPNVTNEVTGSVNPRAIYNAMQSQLGDAFKTGKIKGDLADIADYAKALPPLRQGSQTFERANAESLSGKLMALPKYLAAKGLLSKPANDYLSRGLLGDYQQSVIAGELARRGLLPAGSAMASPFFSYPVMAEQ